MNGALEKLRSAQRLSINKQPLDDYGDLQIR